MKTADEKLGEFCQMMTMMTVGKVWSGMGRKNWRPHFLSYAKRKILRQLDSGSGSKVANVPQFSCCCAVCLFCCWYRCFLVFVAKVAKNKRHTLFFFFFYQQYHLSTQRVEQQ